MKRLKREIFVQQILMELQFLFLLTSLVLSLLYAEKTLKLFENTDRILVTTGDTCCDNQGRQFIYAHAHKMRAQKSVLHILRS